MISTGVRACLTDRGQHQLSSFWPHGRALVPYSLNKVSFEQS